MPDIDSLKHKDTRVNIPTRELDDFVADDEANPKVVEYPGLLYARDPSLDPQLVWKGKDAQDREALAVPAVPIYIQEKVHPQAIIENLRAGKAKATAEESLSLFADFNGIEFEEMIDFYHHQHKWQNRLILGDSLLVMASLAEKEGLKGQVQCIYLDPPYGIKFGSNWQVSTRKRDVKDGKAEDATRQPEQIKAFRDTWELGIHSYLAYLRDRLVVARELLTESGSVFVQIGYENMHLVRCLMDEVFGAENFVSLITFRTTTNLVGNYLGRNSDFLLFYARDIDHLKYRQLYTPRTLADDIGSRYTRLELSDGTRRVMTDQERDDPNSFPAGAHVYRHDNLTSQGATPSGTINLEFQGRQYHPGSSRHWTTAPDGLNRLLKSDRLAAPSPNSLAYVRFLDDFPVGEYTCVWQDTQTGAFTDDKVYVVQTNTKVIERCLLMATDPGDLVIDPTCGSGTTAYIAEQWGRRWITIDTSRVSLALARTRIMAAKYPYYLLADSEDGIKKDAEVTGQVPPMSLPKTEGDIKKGFVNKHVPHITLKSIANNPEIDEIYERWQLKLDDVCTFLFSAIGKSLKEWEMPHKAEEGWPNEAAGFLDQWWMWRRQRQQEIDAAIARHADQETLYDQPYEDNKRIRVAGPFTVESLSPHRVLPADEDGDGAVSEREAGLRQDFATMILENLKKAGVQNTVRNERLKFDRLDPFAGAWLQAEGEYTDKAGMSRRVAISLGPEHGTVGPEQVKEAAKEAMKGVGFDLLIVCGFAFDAHAGETAKEFTPAEKDAGGFATAEEERRYGKLPVLLARMNPDLAMGDELLKKTGAGNLFMVFGEPDLLITRQPGGKLQAELRGVDIYDPTTGEIRSSSTDDIACWFIDTDYNGESFFVRHAYFTGADQPYEKLKRALRADIDESAWASLYSTKSRPFPTPTSGKIAVKVINHYGDEVLKVYEVR